MRDEEGEKEEEEEWEAAEPLASEVHVGGKGGLGLDLSVTVRAGLGQTASSIMSELPLNIGLCSVVSR